MNDAGPRLFVKDGDLAEYFPFPDRPCFFAPEQQLKGTFRNQKKAFISLMFKREYFIVGVV